MYIACVFIKTETLEEMTNLTSPLVIADGVEDNTTVHLAIGQPFETEVSERWSQLAGELAAVLMSEEGEVK